MKLIGELFSNPLAKARQAEGPLPLRNTAQSPQPNVFKFRYGYAGRQLLGAVVALGLGYLFWWLKISGLPALFLFPALALVILWCLTFRETQIQTTSPRVTHQWLFLGIVPIWRRDYPLEAFKGIQCRHRDISEARDSTFYMWTVGLLCQSGQFLPVQWFAGGDITKVDAYASRLGEITRLPLLEDTGV